MRTLDLFQSQLVRRLKHSTWPKHRRLKLQVGFEFVRAAVDGREPALWARSALRPIRSRRATK